MVWVTNLPPTESHDAENGFGNGERRELRCARGYQRSDHKQREDEALIAIDVEHTVGAEEVAPRRVR